ncbi:MAG: NAD(P)H-dependent oxidoreductase [Sandaracinaceae bacterium]|nr:NAD(P)H-dependent oxidoreductase [Sandaracinaceae bacterium]
MTDTKSLSILALSGSLRAESLNTALLRAAGELAPSDVVLTLHDLRALPLYDDDLEVPPAVTALREAVRAADAVLLAGPEYNYSLSGVLKNALDWASRPAYRSPFRDKPCAVLSASTSAVGGARAQMHTKTILLGMAADVFPWPELLVASANTKFEDGQLTDPRTREQLAELMAGFAAWARRRRA